MFSFVILSAHAYVDYRCLAGTVAGITMVAAVATTTEAGGTASFTIHLDSLPSAAVTIDIGSNNTAEGTVSSPAVEFTSVNWDTVQKLTVTGVDDVVIDGDRMYTVEAAARSADPDYHNLDASDIVISNTDGKGALVCIACSIPFGSIVRWLVHTYLRLSEVLFTHS
jgi:hypothetical protein